MSHKRIFLSAALVIMLTSTGCSKSRWLSRNDYSEMHDPFMEGESAVAETPAVPKASNGAGRARLDDSDTASISMAQVPSSRSAANGAPLSGPKPIQQASGTAAARSPVSQASYPQEAAGQSAEYHGIISQPRRGHHFQTSCLSPALRCLKAIQQRLQPPLRRAPMTLDS